MRSCTFVCLLAVSMIVTVPTFGTEIDPGPVSGDWYSSGNPYNINGEIIIPITDTLTIHPGAEVIFQGHYKLIVYGWLLAMGAEGDSITFDAANPTTGWHGIRFISAQDSSHLSYCIIQHGRATGTNSEDPDTWGGGILFDASNPVMTHCIIRNNWAQYFDGGITIINSSNPILNQCTIANNASNLDEGGIGIIYGANATLIQCAIQHNIAWLGAGVVIWNAQATISNCTISDNIGNHAGGGIYIHSSNPRISGCVISGNSSGTGYNGGGVYIEGMPSPQFESCDIINNTSGNCGGGLRITSGGNPVITGCTISGNTAADNGGGISCNDCPNPVVTSCVISDNGSMGYGGGVELTINAHMSLNRCIISGNTASNYGGGIECNYGSTPIITNCTISGNTATSGSGGGISTYQASPAVKNTIIEGNIGDGLYCYESPEAGFTYCDFWDNDIVGCPPDICVPAGTNANGDSCDVYMNICMDPLYYAVGGDSAFHLTEVSPCIDAGDPASPLDPDTTIVDIGRYYFHQTPSGVEPLASAYPSQFHLFPNYPNPFNASTILRYSLPHPGIVTLTIHNILGQKAATLFEGTQQPGVHTITWDASNVGSGIYFARLNNGIQTRCTKMILLK